MLDILLWSILFLLAYVYVGYPTILYIAAKCSSTNRRRTPHVSNWPSATLVIPVHNGERVLADKLRNNDQLNYDGPLNILFVLDGCTDASEGLIHDHVERGDARWPTTWHATSERVGKERALRAALTNVDSDVLVFSDADASFSPVTIQELTAALADPQAGVACGRETHVSRKKQTGAGEGEGLFYKYENAIKRSLSCVSSLTYVQGGVFAIKRHLYPRQLHDGCTQDGAIAFETVLKGLEVRFVPSAVSVEHYDISTKQDFARRIRTVCRAFYTILRYWRVLDPGKTGWYGVHLLSHRVLRWFFVPLFVASSMLSFSLALEKPAYALLAAAHACFLVAAGVGWALERNHRRLRPLYIAYYFTYLHLAGFVGVLKALFGKRVAIWQPTGVQAPAALPSDLSVVGLPEPARSAGSSFEVISTETAYAAYEQKAA